MGKTTKTITAYNENVKNYASKFMNFQEYKEKIIEFSSDINENDRILDLGCGPGNVMKFLESTKVKLNFVGVDLSEEMVKVAKENISEGKFYCQDLRKLDIEEKEFDVLIMSFCIVHLFEKEALELIEKASKLLKKNGMFYISFMEGKESAYETTSFSGKEIYFNYYSSEIIEKELEKVGIVPYKKYNVDYEESDGSFTTDVFIFGEKS